MTDTWAEKHKNKYAGSTWIGKPSLFAETAITYFPKTGKVLELGAGQGQDSRFFAQSDYEVVSTDLEQSALEISKTKLPAELAAAITLQRLDLRHALPFKDKSFDVVYAHLSLHYFDTGKTQQIFDEIQRVLRPGGVLAFLVNSTSDPECGTGEKIESDYFYTDSSPKRFFTVESAAGFTSGFETRLLDNQGESYKDAAKGVHNLIRFVGTKPEQDRLNNDQRAMWDQKYKTRQGTYTELAPLDFAVEVAPNLAPGAKLLELGCGLGSDAAYFAEHGVEVVATDFSEAGIAGAKATKHTSNLTFQLVDMAQPFPYSDATFDAVYSHLALHYYNEELTEAIFSEIARVLKDEGMLYFSCKSLRDPKYGEGTEVEPGVFRRKGHIRHFFSVDYTKRLVAKNFEVVKIKEAEGYYIDGICAFVQC